MCLKSHGRGVEADQGIRVFPDKSVFYEHKMRILQKISGIYKADNSSIPLRTC